MADLQLTFKKPSYCIKTLWSLGLSTAVWDLTGSFQAASLRQGTEEKKITSIINKGQTLT